MKKSRNYRPKPANTLTYNSRRWKKLRDMKFHDNPVCELCLETGKTEVARVIHHVIPWQTGKTDEEIDDLTYSYSNLQSLCHQCHNEIHHKMKLAACYERKKTRS